LKSPDFVHIIFYNHILSFIHLYQDLVWTGSISVHSDSIIMWKCPKCGCWNGTTYAICPCGWEYGDPLRESNGFSRVLQSSGDVQVSEPCPHGVML